MKSNIPMPAIIVAVVVVLALVIAFGYRSLNSDPSKTGVGTDGKPIDAAATQSQPTAPGGKGAAPMAQPNN